MPILNYSTTVTVDRSLHEITARLAKHGATRIQTVYDGGQPVALGFAIDTKFGVQGFDLPANMAGVQATLAKHRPRLAPRFLTDEHASRVAWRILKDWLEAQLAIIESGMVTLDEVMLPYMVSGTSGATLVQLYRSKGPLAIEAAS